jgi:hypothetical protein
MAGDGMKASLTPANPMATPATIADLCMLESAFCLHPEQPHVTTLR